MAFIGPGSEWFWTALSGVVLAGTALAIYRQLKDAQGAALLARQEILLGKWQGRALGYARLRVLIALRDKQMPEPGDPAVADIFFFFESLAGLWESGAFSDAELYNQWGWAIRPWWRVLGPLVQAEREVLGFAVWGGFEGLDAACARMDKRESLVRPVLEGPVDYAGMIARARDRLQMAIDVEAGVIPSG